MIIAPPKSTISWVEDDIDVIGSILRPFQDEKIRVDPYKNYAEAWNSRQKIAKTSILLLDLILPWGNKVTEERYGEIHEISYGGILLLRNLRNEGIWPPTLVFSVAAHDRNPILNELNDLGVSYINKIVRSSELAEKICETAGWGYQAEQLNRK